MTEEKKDLIPEVKPEKPIEAGESEDIKTLRAELEGRIQTLDEAHKGEQRVSSKKEKENQRLQGLLDDREAQEGTMKALIAMMAEQKGQTEEELGEDVKKRQPDLLTQFDKIQGDLKQKRQAEQFQTQLRGIQERTEALGLTTEDEDYQDIRDFAESGNFRRAEFKLKKLETAKATPKEEKKAEPTAKDIEEAARQHLEDKGLLTTDIGAPSGGGGGKTFTRAEVEKMDWKEFEKNFPGETFWEALGGGRIKE